MGADAFLVCYGLRWEMSADDEEEITLLEKRRHPHQMAARDHQLESWWGVTAEEGKYCLLVGKVVGRFGWEHTHAARWNDGELREVAEETKSRLRAAGFEMEPEWHLQFEPDD